MPVLFSYFRDSINQSIEERVLKIRNHYRHDPRPLKAQIPRSSARNEIIFLHHLLYMFPRQRLHLIRVIDNSGYSGNRHPCKLRNFSELQHFYFCGAPVYSVTDYISFCALLPNTKVSPIRQARIIRNPLRCLRMIRLSASQTVRRSLRKNSRHEAYPYRYCAGNLR